MSRRPLHLLGSPVLRQHTAPTGPPDAETRRLVEDLLETMKAENGIGLAANQVGEARRVAVVDTGDGEPLVLIDPLILERTGEDTAEEGCLSIPELFGEVTRAKSVVVEATNLENQRYRAAVTDLKARAVQHEIDHLDGVLFIDHLSPIKRSILLAKWRKARKGRKGYIKEIVEEPARDA